MIAWLIRKLSGPVLPILIQVYKVAGAVETNLNEIIDILTKMGVSIPSNAPVLTTIQTIISAATAIKVAVEKTITLLGGTVPLSAKLAVNDLNKEIEELKKLL